MGTETAVTSMKSDVVQYERAYQRLKSKIESGLLPVGTKLPGRSVLCREFGTSERTIRHALELLVQDGFLEVSPRKRPTVISAFAAPEGRTLQRARKADAAQVQDLLQTGILLCYPIYLRGLRLCTGAEWETPNKLFGRMDPNLPGEFWQLSSRLWRFFIARNENELLLRAVDSLGFRGKEPPSGSLEERSRYLTNIQELFQTVQRGGEPTRAELEQIFSQYRAIAEQAGDLQFLQPLSPCPMLAEADGLDQQLSLAQERYSTVCLDLLGKIAIGRYQPGDRLPTHDQLQELYGVSRDTTVKAIQMLRKWGVVTAAPRRGITVELDLNGLQKIPIEPEAIACHVRRYLDSLDLLSVTAGTVAAHAAAHAEPQEAERLLHIICKQWDHPYGHPLIPRALLDFILEHIAYDALRSIYGVLARNFSIGRSIPKLVRQEKTPLNRSVYQQCADAANMLIRGDAGRFAKAAGGMFEQVHRLTVQECKRLGYWDAAMRVYDGTALWK